MRRSRFGFVLAPVLALLLLAGVRQLASQPQPNQPQPAQRLRIPDDVEVVRDVEFGKGGERALKLDIVRPKNLPKTPTPVVVFIHGGGWRRGNKTAGIVRLIPLAQRGYFGATIDYRLSDEAIFPAQIEDCKCAIRFLRAKAKEYKLDAKHIGVWGTSAGGHLVALLGTSGGAKDLEGKGGWEKESSRVQAVVDCFGPTDFLKLIEDAKKSGRSVEQLKRIGAASPINQLLGGPFWEKEDACRRASPVTYVTKDDPPFLILHGDQDPLVPLSQSEVLNDDLKKAGVKTTLHVVKGAGHGWFRGHPEVDQMVMAFFDQNLKKQ